MVKLNIFKYISNNNIKNKILSITFFCVFFFSSDCLNGKIFDESIINNFHNSLKLNNVSNENINERVEKLKISIEDTFNYNKMIKYIYGYQWKKLEQYERNELSQTFFNFISFNYAKRFKEIDKLNFKFDGVENINETRILVKTIMLSSENEPIKFYYVFEYEEEKWKVFDILLDGSISEISVKKNDFKRTISDEGASGLKNISKKCFSIRSFNKMFLIWCSFIGKSRRNCNSINF